MEPSTISSLVTPCDAMALEAISAMLASMVAFLRQVVLRVIRVVSLWVRVVKAEKSRSCKLTITLTGTWLRFEPRISLVPIYV